MSTPNEQEKRGKDFVATREPNQSEDSVVLKHERIPGPLSFQNCSALLDVLRHCFVDWPFVPDRSRRSPVISVRGTTGGYVMYSRSGREPIRHTTPVDTACALIAELFWPILEANRDLLCLHGAAAEIAGKLIVFPNRYRAGKSVLSACLAARGVRLFTDDVLPFESTSGLGVAMGIRPRLRLPLPSNLSESTREFLYSCWGPRSHRYVYLDLDRSRIAAANEKRPIGAFVFLDRAETGNPVLESVSRREALRDIIWQNFARDSHAASIIQRLRAAVERTPCFRLRYSRADEAAAHILNAFADGSRIDTESDTGTTCRLDVDHQSSDYAQELEPGEYVQCPGIFRTTVEGESFLASQTGGAIFHLNAIGSGIWEALAEPTSDDHLIDLVSSAFPSTSLEVIACDVNRLLADLLARGLIRRGNEV